MKTLLFKEIDGYKIVIGFDKILVDAVETSKKIKKEIFKSTTFKSVQSIGLRLAVLDTRSNKDEVLRLRKDLKAKKKILEKEMKQLYKSNLSFFQPRKGEIVIDEDVFKTSKKDFKAALESGKVLVFTESGNGFDFNSVEDNKGKKYFIYENEVLVEKAILKVGEVFPAGHIVKPSLKQQDEMFNGSLKNSDLDSALNMAALMKNKLEIKGKTAQEALTESQTWYNNKVQEIELKYV